MKTKVTIKALKEIPHGFGVLKYFLCCFVVYFKRLESIWNTCKLFESLHGQFRVPAAVRCVRRKEKPLPHVCDMTLWGKGPQLYLILDGTPEGCAALTNKALLSGREGTVEFPLVGEHPSFSFSRYSAWTGLWHWRTLIASSTLNHSLFLPGEQ